MQRQRSRYVHRQALTLIEVLVILAVLGLLLAISSVNLVDQRVSSRRVMCLNNMRNVSMSMQWYATDHQGELPPLTDATRPLGIGFGNRPASWSVQLLPYLDQTALYERVQSVRTKGEANQLAEVNIEVYTCAADPLEEAAGRLGFVVYTSYMTSRRWDELNNTSHALDAYDYPFDGTGTITSADQDVTFATGVFWRADANTPPTLRANLSQFWRNDGASQTLMLSENLDTRTFIAQTQQGGWVSHATGDLAFAVEVAETAPSVVADNSIEAGMGVPGTPSQPMLSTALAPNPSIHLVASAINSISKMTTPGQSSRPRSIHPGVVNTMFCDGSGKTISENMNHDVYVRLMTPNGNRYGQLLLQATDF